MKLKNLAITGFIIFPMVIGLVGLTGCDSESGPTSPAGTATLQGQILREPTVILASSTKDNFIRTLTAFTISEVWAASSQPVPLTNMRVGLTANGQFMGSTMTDSYGRFRFDGMPSGMYELMIQDSNGRYSFNHSMSMGTGDMMAAYGVMWVNGNNIQMTWDHQSGDHWDDMMDGVPGSRWDMDKHRMM